MINLLGFPSAIITFLFTDLEESTKLWEDFPKEMKAALARLDVILKSADENKHRKITGDGLDAAFPSQATPLMQHWLPR